MTSADKLLGENTTQSPWRHTHSRPLDSSQGSGLLNVAKAYDVYTTGRHEAGSVPLQGWDLGYVTATTGQNDYQLANVLTPGDQIVATLAWNRYVNSNYQASPLTNLGLKLLSVQSGQIVDLSMTSSAVDNVKQIVYTVPYGQSGAYRLLVCNSDVAGEDYGLAWRTIRQGVDVPRNLVSNGDFATGDFVAWTLTGSPTLVPQDEGYGDYFAARLENDEVIRQTVKVPNDLKVAFDYQFDGAPGSSASLWVSIGDLLQQSIQLTSNNTGLHRFEVPFDVTNLVGQDLDLIFSTYTSGPGVGVYLDNVLVTPEPATLSLLALGGLALLRWQRAGSAQALPRRGG